MTLEEEIIAALRAAPLKAGGLVDPHAGRRLELSLQAALFGRGVEDRTDYPGGRTYRFHSRVFAGDTGVWRHLLQVRISGIGPYATQTFVQTYGHHQVWSGAVRTSRSGFHPDHLDALERLRVWYLANGLQELDMRTKACPVPTDVQLPWLRAGQGTLCQILFAD